MCSSTVNQSPTVCARSRSNRRCRSRADQCRRRLWQSFEREAELVLGDVLDHYVTLDHAREDYGVVIDAQTMSVDSPSHTKLPRIETYVVNNPLPAAKEKS